MQTRKSSLAEAIISTAIGFVISIGIMHFCAWLFGWPLRAGQDFAAVAIFTVASIIRQYWVRRAFNWWHFGRAAAPRIHEGAVFIVRSPGEATKPDPNMVPREPIRETLTGVNSAGNGRRYADRTLPRERLG